MTVLDHLSLSELFKAKDHFQALNDLGFWFEPELKEVDRAIQQHNENPDRERP